MEKKSLSPKTKKAMIYGGIAAVGLGLVYVTTLQTSSKPKIKEPEEISLTGNADTRSVSLEGLNRRLSELETGGLRDAVNLRNEITRLQTMNDNLARQLEQANKDSREAIDKLAADLKEQGSQPVIVQAPAPAATGQGGAQQPARVTATITPAKPVIRSSDDILRERERRQTEIKQQESIYVPPEPPPVMQQQNNAAAPAPRIAVFSAPEPDPNEVRSQIASNVPDIQVPAGSILPAYLLTGLDAPTGTRAASQPVPVLMRIKKEAILPNYAWADVTDCHLLGSAYGELGSERVNIRGETVSCILRDNTAVEGAVKFFVTGEDGKNGIKGTLVSRSGRVLASAAGAALAQGLLSSLNSGTSESVFFGGSGESSGALDGASKGFDLLTEYYLDLAEQTFPVIEVTNDRWVDVVLTEMLTIKFKG